MTPNNVLDPTKKRSPRGKGGDTRGSKRKTKNERESDSFARLSHPLQKREKSFGSERGGGLQAAHRPDGGTSTSEGAQYIFSRDQKKKKPNGFISLIGVGKKRKKREQKPLDGSKEEPTCVGRVGKTRNSHKVKTSRQQKADRRANGCCLLRRKGRREKGHLIAWQGSTRRGKGRKRVDRGGINRHQKMEKGSKANPRGKLYQKVQGDLACDWKRGRVQSKADQQRPAKGASMKKREGSERR